MNEVIWPFLNIGFGAPNILFLLVAVGLLCICSAFFLYWKKTMIALREDMKNTQTALSEAISSNTRHIVGTMLEDAHAKYEKANQHFESSFAKHIQNFEGSFKSHIQNFDGTFEKHLQAVTDQHHELNKKVSEQYLALNKQTSDQYVESNKKANDLYIEKIQKNISEQAVSTQNLLKSQMEQSASLFSKWEQEITKTTLSFKDALEKNHASVESIQTSLETQKDMLLEWSSHISTYMSDSEKNHEQNSNHIMKLMNESVVAQVETIQQMIAKQAEIMQQANQSQAEIMQKITTTQAESISQLTATQSESIEQISSTQSDRMVAFEKTVREAVTEILGSIQAASNELSATSEAMATTTEQYHRAAEQWLSNLGRTEAAITEAGTEAAADALGHHLSHMHALFDQQLRFQEELYEQLTTVQKSMHAADSAEPADLTETQVS